MFKLDIEPISHRLKNNKDAHKDYLKKTIENTDIIRRLVERARKHNPSEPILNSACMFTKHVQELLVYVSKTFPSLTKPSEKLVAVTPLNKDKKVRFADPPTGNIKNNKISQPSSSNKTNKVQDQSKSVKSKKNKKNHVVKTECNAYVMQSMLNANSRYVCAIYNECLFDANHDKYVLDYVHDVNVLSKSKPAKRKNKKKIWKPTVPLKETTIKSVLTPTQRIKVYSRRPKTTKSVGSSSESKSIESRISNQLKPTQSGESNVSNVPSSSLINYRECYHFQGFYVEGLGHNLFSIGQFCESDLKVTFRKHTCFVRNLKVVDILLGSRGTNLYTFSFGDMMKSSPICLLSKASKTKSWLWHRRLSHLNFGTINQLAKQGLVRGLLKLKFEKD
ncbi:retrovirus-related pol polyprotein from transposon TNT 1-94 [Tanacetum coccineum]|uniref:Retrovirus-related pol polyprotein from transposon TNT 1-94 n=1 Tax=Tanacetum coccineum TaxID=301880 RepID=A0ABQ5CUF6_9ASTR